MKKVKWKQYVLILLCAALLCAEGTVNAMGKGSGMGEGTDKWRISGEGFLFEDKDIVGFIGDSITHVSTYSFI